MDEFCVKLSGRLKNIIFDMEYSASIGMTTGDDRELTFKDLYYEADQAMYYSKRQGKNRISFFDSIRKNGITVPHNSCAPSNTDVSCKLSDMEIFSYDEMPDYILAVDEESRRIVFVNKVIRNSSVMTASQIDEFISKPFDDGFIDLFLRKKEQGNRVSVFSGKDHPDNIVAKLLGEKKLIIKLNHKDYNGYRLLMMIDLSDESKLNAVMRRIINYRSFMQNFIDAINDTTEAIRLLQSRKNRVISAEETSCKNRQNIIMQIVWLSFIMERVRGTQLRRYIYQVLRLWQRWLMNLFQEVQLQIFSLCLMTPVVCL